MLGCLGGGILVIAGLAVIGSASKSHPSSPAAIPQLHTLATVPVHSAAPVKAAVPVRSTAAAAATPALVAAFSGSGEQNTAQFTVTSTWALSYAFDCSAFGQTGNFQVYTDGSFGGATVNDLAAGKSAVTYAYNDPGTHYLEINSECSWSVKVYDEG